MYRNDITRRDAVRTLSTGLGGIAMTALGAEKSFASSSSSPLTAKDTHFKPRAKSVIYLSMRGAPSHVDTFDYKPQLSQDTGKSSKYAGKLLGSPWEFSQHGDSGLWISELFPNVAKHADDLCLLNGMHQDSSNHRPAVTATHTGSVNFIRPSMGSWALYGLGTENTNLPGYIVLGGGQKGDYGSAFLPAYYQGTMIGGKSNLPGPPRVPNIRSTSMDAKAQRSQLDFVQMLNRNMLQRDVHSPIAEGMMQSAELAYSMQTSMPELLDYESESAATIEAYGLNNSGTAGFGKNCLLARRMVERGVRFVEIVHGSWDHHDKLKESMTKTCGETDGPIAALLEDLKQRDLLKDTLILWGGEFGRTPNGSADGDGRGHNAKGYTTWMAGGGVKGGIRYGATDEHGYEAVEGRLHLHDWHATILHLLGLDHEQLTYRYAGRDFRLTDVHGYVPKEILA